MHTDDHSSHVDRSAADDDTISDSGQAANAHNSNLVVEIWIGYVKAGRTYIDRHAKASDTEEQIRRLGGYYRERFGSGARFARRWLYCQKPIVQVGQLRVSTFDVFGGQNYPREVHFEHVHKADILTAGFARPELLRNDERFFHECTSFDVTPGMMAYRTVLCINHEVNKRRLIWPLAFSFTASIVVAVVVGVMAQSVSSGAEAGGLVGVAIVLLWTYILWLLT